MGILGRRLGDGMVKGVELVVGGGDGLRKCIRDLVG